MSLCATLKEKRLLLIDDDEWIRDSLSLFFELEGCSIVALETAEEGLKELSRRSYDIIIVDYKLPGMNGLEFFKRIAAFYRHTIKIFISAYGNAELIAEALKTGVQEFIEKPLNAECIEESLVRLLKKNQFDLVTKGGERNEIQTHYTLGGRTSKESRSCAFCFCYFVIPRSTDKSAH